MLERIIFSALKDGITELVADPQELERIFHLRGLDDAEATRLTDLFRRFKPDVIHNYPREDSTFPLYAIILGDENETSKFLDDTGGVVEEDEAKLLGDLVLSGVIKRTSIYTSQYHIWTATDGPDTTVAYYQVAKYILTKKRAFMKMHGVLDSALSGGDLAPNMNYLPAYLFIRRLSLTCQFEEPVFDDPTGRVRSVDGIFVDDGSSTDRLGGVEARVDVTIEDVGG